MDKGRLFFGFLFSLLITLNIQTAYAFPLTSDRPWLPSNDYSLMFDPGFPVDSVVGMSNCSASLIHFKGVSEDALATVLTNGHCVGSGFSGMLRPGEIYYNKPQKFNMRLLNRTGQTIANLRADKIIYATMTNTDLAILELNQTYRQIREATGILPLEVSEIPPEVGTQIQIPSGYWKRTYSCQIEETVHELHEGGWVFKKSLRYSPTGCEVIGGTSGSPIVNALTGEVIAINNTGNESGQRCTRNNPCEVSETGEVRIIPGRGYGQQVFNLYTCLNEQGRFDIDRMGCALPNGPH